MSSKKGGLIPSNSSEPLVVNFDDDKIVICLYTCKMCSYIFLCQITNDKPAIWYESTNYNSVTEFNVE